MFIEGNSVSVFDEGSNAGRQNHVHIKKHL